MSLINYINRISNIDALIKAKSTGNADALAKTLHLSRPSLLRHIKTMKDLGFPIKYSNKKNSYYYYDSSNSILSFFD